MRAPLILTLFLLVGCQRARQPDPYAHLYDKAAQARPHERLLIEPRASVGKIKTGMRIEEVIAAIGEPDRRGPFVLEYLRFGFAAIANRESVVTAILGGAACDKHSPLIKMFAGRTKEGIGMESTRSEVVAAFGQPTKSESLETGEEHLAYSDLGLEFNLSDGRVHFIQVSLKPQ